MSNSKKPSSDKPEPKASSGAINRRPTPKSGKDQSYGAKAITGKTKKYVG